jgi:hypothetical protein
MKRAAKAIRVSRAAPPARASAPAPVPSPDLVEIFSTEKYPQGSDQWFKLRLGMATASVAKMVLAEGLDGDESKTRATLLYRLAGERISGLPAETFENEAMRRGRTMEFKALSDYSFKSDVEVHQVGFVRRTIKREVSGVRFPDLVVGCSPDGLVGEDGGVQIKTMKPELITRLIDRQTFPTEHKAQCQWEMWVTGRQWWDLKIFYEGISIPPFRLNRIEADMLKIRKAAEAFDWELREILKRLKAKGLG